jgi:hypothetical protein
MELKKQASAKKIVNPQTKISETAYIVAQMSADGYCDHTRLVLESGYVFPFTLGEIGSDDIRFLDKSTDELKALGFTC